MSSLFGQVWLWSLLSFVAGAALTWLVLVRPAKRELEDLEERLLTSPRPASPAGRSAGSTAAPSDEFDNWHVEASRSLADDVLTPEPPRYEPAERTRYEASLDASEAPRYDVTNVKLDQREALLEELDDEHRPLSDFEEQHDFPEFDAAPPRSLFERPAPEDAHDTRNAPGSDRGPRRYEDEPELPAEATTVMPAVPATPVAAVAPPSPEPTAPPEVAVFQPREVWREEPVQEVYDEDEVTDGHEEEDEPERRPSLTEETSLIPATALAQAIAEVDGERRQSEDPEPQVWPEHDLTGHFTPVRQDEPEESDEGPRTEVMRAVVDSGPTGAPEAVEPARSELFREPEAVEARAAEPEAAAEPEVVDEPPFQPTFVPPADAEPQHAEPQHAEPQHAEPQHAQPQHAEPQDKAAEPQHAEPKKAEPKKAEPTRPRSLFEPLPESEHEQEPEPDQPRPNRPPIGDDQPFVPTLSPELLAGNPTPLTANGLPQRGSRQAGPPRTPPPAPLAPKPATPPPARPVRPRPVGFSPSTGGRPAPGSTRFQGQQEGFNPRSPFGPGSVLPKSDGLAPAPEFQVKATLTGRRYFTDGSANFRETRADVWFRTTTDAEKAGFRPAP
ncbi:sunset domain-containing protein [Saccharothrix sp. NRRL B-16314]|uniref:sunset domain-containing protein n=1 Tax=Saccharothrix sp. NRRL B-16314 TaxID=1463825 RepID=UPI000524BA27|nr:hypothetical protein [Saccharothrix sp. NRRL B-16314]